MKTVGEIFLEMADGESLFLQTLPPLPKIMLRIPEVYRECLAVIMFFETVGVERADISLGFADGDLLVAADLKPNPMVIRIARMAAGTTEAAIEKAWHRAKTIWNQAGKKACCLLVEHAKVTKDFPRFISEAAAMGLVFPVIADMTMAIRSPMHKGPRN